MSDINHLLETLQEGDPVAADQLLVLVYTELRGGPLWVSCEILRERLDGKCILW